MKGNEAFDRRQGLLFRICVLLLPLLSVLEWVGESRSNGYAISEFFLTYKHGFLKRALLGEALSRLGYLSSHRIAEIEIALVLVALGMSYLVFWRMLRSGVDGALLALVFLCSPACLPHFAALAAQPDVQLYGLTLLAYLCLTRLPGRFAPVVALLPCVLAALVHEAFTLLFYPAIVALLWDGYRQGRYTLAALAIHGATYGAAFLAILHFGKTHVDPLVLYREAQARTDRFLQPEVFGVLSFDFSQQWNQLMSLYTRTLVGAVMVSIGFLTPYLVGTGMLTLKANGARRRPLPVLGVAAIFLTPMTLVFLGHDVLRWLAGAEVSLLLFLVYLYETREPGEPGSFPSMQSPATYAVLLYGLAIGPMGGATVRALTRTVELLNGA